MQFAITIALFFAAVVTATPAPAPVCPPGLLTGSAQCCAVDAEGVADVDCEVPKRTPTDGADFGKMCHEIGKSAMCCGVTVANEAVKCQKAVGAQ